MLSNDFKFLSLECLLLLALDWAIFTVGMLSLYTVLTVCLDAVIRIILVCKVLRYVEKSANLHSAEGILVQIVMHGPKFH